MPTPGPLRYTTAVLNGFSQIFLQAHPGGGLLILLAIALHDAALLVGAVAGGLAGTLSAVVLGYRQPDIDLGLYGYNAILLGLLFVLLLGLSPLTLGLILVSAVAVNLLQAQLISAMRERNWLPGFTLPFVVFGWVLLGLVNALELSTQTGLDAPLPMDAAGLLCAVATGIAQVMFLDQPLAGLVLLVAIGLADRRDAAWVLCGAAAGVAAGLAIGEPEQQVLAGLSGYNPVLAALAVSQVHRSALAPLLAIIAAILLRLVFDRLGLPPLTMPFILAYWLVALAGRWHSSRVENA